MKIFKWLLWIMFAGIALYTLAFLNGFGGETIPKNRTKEQYEFEKTFEPLFKFLEQDKKEFTGLKAYTSRVYIKNQDEVKKYEVDLDITQSDIKGDYTKEIPFDYLELAKRMWFEEKDGIEPDLSYAGYLDLPIEKLSIHLKLNKWMHDNRWNYVRLKEGITN